MCGINGDANVNGTDSVNGLENTNVNGTDNTNANGIMTGIRKATNVCVIVKSRWTKTLTCIL